MTIVRFPFVFVLLASIGACSSGSGSKGTGGTGASAGASATGGTGANGGGGASGGTAGGGSAGMVGANCCPAQRPTMGSDCTGCEDTSCTYLDCADPSGSISEHTCSVDGTWGEGTAANCGAFDCGGTTCQAGQICVEQAGGALIYVCADNPCVGQALTCSCGASACPGKCEGFTGTTLMCNTCPEGNCP